MPAVGAIALYVSLLTFTLRVHPDRLDYVDQVLVCTIYFDLSLLMCAYISSSIYLDISPLLKKFKVLVRILNHVHMTDKYGSCEVYPIS